jgi:hypothetical protein
MQPDTQTVSSPAPSRCNVALAVLPVWDAARALWTWTDGEVCYEAYSRRALANNIKEGEGCAVRLVSVDRGKVRAGHHKVGNPRGRYKDLHPQNEAVLDLWSLGNNRGQIALDLRLSSYVVHKIIERARYHQDPRVSARYTRERAA